ncbi:MAG: hypothetical protein Pg6C_12600 [Treponemataceae bacterium]|nr:MAG: hypothetical protein Pg6C_12600 [Treponemataceae bacterium]
MNALLNPAPQPGDVVYVNRGVYKHYGVYVAEGLVVHFAPPDGSAETDAEHAVIHETSAAGFLKGGELQIDTQDRRGSSPEEVVRRARSQIGSKGYNLVFNNCEHFARWCKTGIAESEQVNAAVEIVVRGLNYGVDMLYGEADIKDGEKLRKKLQQFFR